MFNFSPMAFFAIEMNESLGSKLLSSLEDVDLTLDKTESVDGFMLQIVKERTNFSSAILSIRRHNVIE